MWVPARKLAVPRELKHARVMRSPAMSGSDRRPFASREAELVFRSGTCLPDADFRPLGSATQTVLLDFVVDTAGRDAEQPRRTALISALSLQGGGDEPTLIICE